MDETVKLVGSILGATLGIITLIGHFWRVRTRPKILVQMAYGDEVLRDPAFKGVDVGKSCSVVFLLTNKPEECKTFVPVPFRIKNTGPSAAKNVKVEIRMPLDFAVGDLEALKAVFDGRLLVRISEDGKCARASSLDVNKLGWDSRRCADVASKALISYDVGTLHGGDEVASGEFFMWNSRKKFHRSSVFPRDSLIREELAHFDNFVELFPFDITVFSDNHPKVTRTFCLVWVAESFAVEPQLKIPQGVAWINRCLEMLPVLHGTPEKGGGFVVRALFWDPPFARRSVQSFLFADFADCVDKEGSKVKIFDSAKTATIVQPISEPGWDFLKEWAPWPQLRRLRPTKPSKLGARKGSEDEG